MDALERITTAIKAAGSVIDLKEMVALYEPLHETEPYPNLIVRRDLAYGPHERHRADLFVLPGGDRRPVLLFVHGGGYIAGDRRVRPGSPFYDNVALWAARHGFLAVNMSYRLAPAAGWPAVQEDIADALRWLAANTSSFGGDPQSVVLMGHSAGATHVACFLGQAPETELRSIKAAILLSATLRAIRDDEIGPEDGPFVGHERAYFGADPSAYDERGALPGLPGCGVPVMAISPEFDPSFFQRHHDNLARLLTKAGSIHQAERLPGHNHMSQIFCLNTRDTRLSEAILGFVRRAFDDASRGDAAAAPVDHIHGAR